MFLVSSSGLLLDIIAVLILSKLTSIVALKEEGLWLIDLQIFRL